MADEYKHIVIKWNETSVISHLVGYAAVQMMQTHLVPLAQRQEDVAYFAFEVGLTAAEGDLMTAEVAEVMEKRVKMVYSDKNY